jgi:hypothetical protein
MSYLLKRRPLLGYGAPSKLRPHGTMQRGKWTRLSAHATAAEALAAKEQCTSGLFEWAVFHRGRRIDEEQQP